MKNVFNFKRTEYFYCLDSFKGNLLLWCRLLLPSAVKIIYNLQSKQLVKIFSRVRI